MAKTEDQRDIDRIVEQLRTIADLIAMRTIADHGRGSDRKAVVAALKKSFPLAVRPIPRRRGVKRA